MKYIGVLYGGKTGEHQVSCRSAASVVANLDRSRFEPVLIGIDDTGVWYLQESIVLEGPRSTPFLGLSRRNEQVVHAIPGRGLVTESGAIRLDFVFPVLHGTFGEDGTVQGLLELVEIPYAGATVLGSAVGMDKAVSKRLWEQAGLPVVPYFVVTSHGFRTGATTAEWLDGEIQRRFGFPVFVKPVCAGSSVGVSKVESGAGLDEAIELALRYDTRLMIEQSITGQEIECSVVGNDSPRAFPPGEIISKHAFYDYEAKYIDPDGAQLVIPARLPQERLEEIQRLTVSAFDACGAVGMARVDFLLDETDGSPYLNEINTIPGFTNISMFSKMCETGGLAYSDLLTTLIDLGLDQFRQRRSLVYRFESPAG